MNANRWGAIVIWLVVSLAFLPACQSKYWVPGSVAEGEIAKGEAARGRLYFPLIGGDLVLEGDPLLRHVVGVYENETGEVCGGVLIDKGRVLTAAHCVGPQMAIVFDQIFRPNSELRFVKKAIVHPAFEVGRSDIADTYDLAILHFEGELPGAYEPAKLITLEISEALNQGLAKLKNGFSTWVVGYGYSRPDTKEGIGELRKVRLSVLDPNYMIFSAMVDQKSGSGVCDGDSGAPAFISYEGNFYLWGIGSHALSSVDSSSCRGVSIFTRLFPFLEFLRTD